MPLEFKNSDNSTNQDNLVFRNADTNPAKSTLIPLIFNSNINLTEENNLVFYNPESECDLVFYDSFRI